VASLSQGRTAAAQCGLFTYKSVPVIFEPPCIIKAWVLFISDATFNCGLSLTQLIQTNTAEGTYGVS